MTSRVGPGVPRATEWIYQVAMAAAERKHNVTADRYATVCTHHFRSHLPNNTT